MNVINALLGVPLGYVMHFAYRLTGGFGWAIVIFTLLSRVLLFPVNTMAHHNAIRFLRLQPALERLKRRFAHDKEQLNEEQYHLFKQEHYNPLIGVVPLIIQLILIMGVLQVMYHPLQHMLRIDQPIIDALVVENQNFGGVVSGPSAQLSVMETLSHPEHVTSFRESLSDPAAQDVIDTIAHAGLDFLGINLGEIPSLTHPTPALIIPALAAVSALIFCLVQNAISPGALTQSARANGIMTVVTVLLSLYFTLVMPAGVGLYWAIGNLISVGIVLILDYLYSPTVLAPEAMAQIRENKALYDPALEKERKNAEKVLRKRETEDAARFNATRKTIVFYALSAGQYQYYAELIDYLLEHSDLTIHYLTNDPDDPVFSHPSARVVAYFHSHKKTITAMLKLDTDILVTTVPDLQNYHLKRSVVREDIEYLYVFHGFTSVHMVMRPGALDHFDTVFCVGPHHFSELRRLEEMHRTKPKRLVKVGYGVFDRLLTRYEQETFDESGTGQILIAPSWQQDNIMESCIDAVLDQLLGKGYRIVVRPHPEYTKAFGNELRALQKRYGQQVESGEVIFELDFRESASMYRSALLITDWSNTAYEFSFTTKKPVVFIDTPMKVMNPNYEEVGLEPTDITLRNQVGISVKPADLDSLGSIVADILARRQEYHDTITSVVDDFIYYPKRSGEAGGKYLIDRLESPTRERGMR